MVSNPSYKKSRYTPGKTGSSFTAFYPFYLGEHADKICRRLHFVGTTLVVFILGAALFQGTAKLLWLAPVAGYGCAWVGHFFFEHNKPATFKHPLYSLMGDFKLWYEIITGQRRL